MKHVAVIAGDGIGPEVISEAVKTIELARQIFDFEAELVAFDWGAEKYLMTGITMPENGLALLANEFDAILTGAFGDPRVPDNKHAADILLGMRFGLDLYINLRPIKLIDAKLCPLKDNRKENINFVVF